MATAAHRSRNSTRASGPSRSRGAAKRTSIVWAALVGAMTLVGGGLWLAGGGSLAQARAAGVRPLMETGRTQASVGGASPAGLDAIFQTPAQVVKGRWQAIVIHDSGTLVGSPAAMDQRAKDSGLKGLGHHFVVGNGSGMQDGELFVSARWVQQQAGAHTGGPDADWYNRQAIGICLVGDGDRQRFSEGQVRRLCQVVDTLCKRLGIPADRVYLHSQIAPTTSPGKYFPEVTLRLQLQGR
jgi:hypothetical protein